MYASRYISLSFTVAKARDLQAKAADLKDFKLRDLQPFALGVFPQSCKQNVLDDV